jgi:hypothetical protein
MLLTSTQAKGVPGQTGYYTSEELSAARVTAAARAAPAVAVEAEKTARCSDSGCADEIITTIIVTTTDDWEMTMNNSKERTEVLLGSRMVPRGLVRTRLAHLVAQSARGTIPVPVQLVDVNERWEAPKRGLAAMSVVCITMRVAALAQIGARLGLRHEELSSSSAWHDF